MPEQADEVRRAFDTRAATYDESAMHRALAEAVVDSLVLDDVRTLVDVATGTGLVLRALHRRAPGIRMIGVDLSPGMLSVARRALPSAEWIEAEAAEAPLPGAIADVITCVTALHMIDDVAAVAAEWRRLLRPGGLVVTATFLRREPPADAAFVRPYAVDHEPFDSIEALTATLAPLGFRVSQHRVWADGTDSVLIAESIAVPGDGENA